MLPPGPGTSGTPREEEELEELYPVIVEHSAQPGDRRRMQERVSIHRRNISTLASPVILVFDGFHNIVYHLYLATRWVKKGVYSIAGSSHQHSTAGICSPWRCCC